MASGAEALDVLTARRPDLLISDIGLPDMDGYALMKAIRVREAASGAPPLFAIALTAFARDEDRRRAEQAGFDRYMTKPFEPTRLIQTLEKMLSKKTR